MVEVWLVARRKRIFGIRRSKLRYPIGVPQLKGRIRWNVVWCRWCQAVG